MPSVDVSSAISMHFETSGEGEPLVFVSGQNTDHTQWLRFAPLFADQFRTIVFDNRGTGQTHTPLTSKLEVRDFANDAVALLDALEIERAHFVGASMGGKIVQWVAIDHPDRIASAVLMATTPGGRQSTGWTPETETALRTAPTGDINDPIVPLLVSERWAQVHPDLALEMALRRINAQGNGARRMHFQASGAHDASGELYRVSAPTLILHGDDDPMCPLANAELLAQLIPGARLDVIAGGRHEFFIEMLDESVELIRQFLLAQQIKAF